MKLLRPIILAILLAGAFFYFTTWKSSPLRLTNLISRPNKLEITEAAGSEPLDAEEQNNILVYRKNIPSVVNITSKAVTFDFFYGLVPQEGQGSGFVIDKEGHILTNYHVIADARQVEVTMHNRKKYTRHGRRHRPLRTTGRHQDQSPRPHPRRARRLAQPASRPEGLRHRQPVRPCRHDDARHRQFDPLRCKSPTAPPSTKPSRPMPPSTPATPVARCMNWARRSHRHQHHDPLQRGPKRRHRLCHPDQYCQSRAQRSSHAWPRPTSRARRLAPSRSAPSSPNKWAFRSISVCSSSRSQPGGAAERAGLRGGSERAYLGNIPIMLGGDLIVAIDGENVAGPARPGPGHECPSRR